MLPTQPPLNRQTGFTLIEVIISIIIVGIVSSVVSLIVGNYLENYDAVTRRTLMQTSAQLAIERISREIRHALPNSICIYNGSACVATAENKLYFVTVKDAGYYQDSVGAYPNNSARQVLPISPATAATKFDIVSETNESNLNAYDDSDTQANDWVAVYNINNSSVYTGNNARKIKTLTNFEYDTGKNIVRVELYNSIAFPLHSPTRRFHIIKPHTAMFYLQGRDLMLGKSANDFANPETAAKSHLLLEHVESLSFSFTSGSQQRIGLLHIDLIVKNQGEQIHIIHEAHIYNVP